MPLKVLPRGCRPPRTRPAGGRNESPSSGAWDRRPDRESTLPGRTSRTSGIVRRPPRALVRRLGYGCRGCGTVESAWVAAMPKYVGALDQGTTSTRFMVFDHAGAVVAIDQHEHVQVYPRPGWVEHDALEIWARCREVIHGALTKAGLTARDLAAIGVANQRETTVVWDRRTGRPVHNAIVWQDTRTDTFIAELAHDGGQDRFRARVGLPLATYFSGPKIRWILDNVPGARDRAKVGELLFGTIDSWVIWNLTGGAADAACGGGARAATGIHLTDVTNASRTMLMNLRTLDWDDEMLAIMGVPRSMLPAIRSSSEVYGEAVG